MFSFVREVLKLSVVIVLSSLFLDHRLEVYSRQPDNYGLSNDRLHRLQAMSQPHLLILSCGPLFGTAEACNYSVLGPR